MNLKPIFLTIPFVLLVGCASAGKQVYIASDTSLGVVGAMNTARTSGKLMLGYDRKFVAYIPKMQDEVGQGDAMATFNCTHVQIKGITVTRFYERLATGDAAIELVSKLPPTQKDTECTYSQ